MQFFSPNLQIQDSAGRSNAIGSAELRVISTDSIGNAVGRQNSGRLTDDVEVMLMGSQDFKSNLLFDNSTNAPPMISSAYDTGFEILNHSSVGNSHIPEFTSDFIQFGEHSNNIPISRESQNWSRKPAVGNLKLGMQQKPSSSFSVNLISEEHEYDFGRQAYSTPLHGQTGQDVTYGLLDSELDMCLGGRY
jgi:hypothetical protein